MTDEQMAGQISIFDLDIWSGKMSQEHSAQTAEKISVSSSKKRQGSLTKMPLFLDLRKDRNGLMQDASWETDSVLLGDYTMHSFGESPNEENESRLSQILEVNPPPKYCLSARACQGILNRAERRGKILPEQLEQALKRQANALTDGMFNQSISNQKTESQNPCIAENVEAAAENPMLCNPSVSRNGGGRPGGGKGILIQNEKIGALTTNNQMVFSIDQGAGKSSVSIAENKSPTLATTHDGAPVVNAPIVLEGNGSRPSHKGNGYAEPVVMSIGNGQANDASTPTTECSKTLNCLDHPGHIAIIKDEQSMWDGTQVAPTLTSNNANGSQRMPDKDNFNAVISFTTEQTPKTDESETAFALRSRDYKDAQAITYGLDRSSYNQGKNAKFDFCIDKEQIGPQTAMGPGAVCTAYDVRNSVESSVNGTLQADSDHNLNSNNVCRVNSIVRRLTPVECERLQGYPDGWTDIGEWFDSKGKKHKEADSPRYKALGNSIALPFWQWMAGRMVQYIPDNPSMASLFDGIGGFPLVFSRVGCEPVWASEIEEFPIAVTKLRFPDKESL